MRGDQPLWIPACPTVSPSTRVKLTHLCQSPKVEPSGVGRAGASVRVLEPDDVVEVRRRDLEDVRVLERRHAMHGAGRVAERGSGADDLLLQEGVADGAELELHAPRLDQPRLVLDAVELEAERVPGVDVQELA